MENTTKVTINIDGKDITLETGLLALQAAGAVHATMGETTLFSAITCTKEPREGIDYFPLQVEYREKFYAAGRFPGGFFKRETRPAEKEILTSRLTDRPIRPLFPKNYRNDVQINNMLLSADGVNDSDMLSIIASSAALTISEIPFMGPIAAVRVGRVDGNFVANPSHEERANSDLDLVYASTRDLPLMIEGGGQEVTEEDLLAAMKFGHVWCEKLIDAQLELREKLGLPVKVVVEDEGDTTILDGAREVGGAELAEAMLIADKTERSAKIDEVRASLNTKLQEKFEEMTKEEFRSAFDDLEIEVVRTNFLNLGKRIDGRPADGLRELTGQIGVLPRTHGSGIFNRGETQSLTTVTLGTKSDSQFLDAVTGGVDEKKFMLHYNFPPYCVGECGRLGFTGRREIGHGNLAERSLQEVIPVDYPYVVRLVSDIMGSNGSSSMASVCAGTLAMMDAGVPITKPVAGISIGLFADENKAVLVTDIIGTEDHCGDMDFKVSGTRDGITGFQVDLKIPGLSWELVEGALKQAKDTRIEIIEFIESVIASPRGVMSKYAPKVEVLKIPTDKIGELIGPGGKNIRRITELSGAQVDIEEDGTIKIYAVGADSMEVALNQINMITAEAEEGKIYDGTVTGIKEFGAFVEILPGKDGLVHISELANERVNNVEDICKLGDQIWVKCLGIDDRGRIKLSRRAALEEKDA